MTIQRVPGKKMETKRLFVGGLYSGIKEVDLRYVLLIINIFVTRCTTYSMFMSD